jgi:hypothetical protein
MTSNEKSLNYKVIDLIESYNFHINFTFIRIHTKKVTISENILTPMSCGSGWECTISPREYYSQMVVAVVSQNLKLVIYF